MSQLQYLNAHGDFRLNHAELFPEVYFPLVNEGNMMSSITPLLAGDCKVDQNTFLLAPASAETLHESRATRNFWVQIKGQQPWSVTGQSGPQRVELFNGGEETVLTAGMLWQKISRTKKDGSLLAEVLSFVPAGKEHVEIMQVALTNCTDRPMELTATAAIPLYCRSADNIRDHRHVTSLLHRARVVKYGLELRPTLTFDERGHQPGQRVWRVFGAEDTGAAPVGCIPRVEDFTGAGSYDMPMALFAPESARWETEGTSSQGGEMIGALRFAEVKLGPGEKKTYQIALAVDDDPSDYLTPEGVSAALEGTKKFWNEVSDLKITTGNPDFDGWLRWVGIQPVLRRICGCSFLPHHDYGRGGRGWRDLWQDSLALLLRDPAGVRQDLLQYFAGVRLDGTNATIIGTKPGEFKADRNNIPRVWMDHGFWPLWTVQLYLDETGDYGFLSEEQPYFSDNMAFRGEGKAREADSPRRTGTVLEHMLLQGVTAFFDVGEHGHIRLRGADWNDGLDMAAQRGESVAFTAAYAQHLSLLSELVKKTGAGEISLPAPLERLLRVSDREPAAMQKALMEYCGAIHESGSRVTVSAEDLSALLAEMSGWIKEHIRRTEWVGDGKGRHWFNSYYDNSGRQVEGLGDRAVRMMLTGQVFCLLSGTADEVQGAEIVRAVEAYLDHPDRGGVCLNTDFQEVKMDMGRMFGFAYGSKENGAVFCHMAVMYAYALYHRGFTKEAWQTLRQLFVQSADFEKSRTLPGVPEYFDDRGRGMYPYLTGSASWLLLAVQTKMFGVRGQGGDLVLEPQLTLEQFDGDGKASIFCHSVGRALRVTYLNPQRAEKYEISEIRCGDSLLKVSGPRAIVPKAILPSREAELTVTLCPVKS